LTKTERFDVYIKHLEKKELTVRQALTVLEKEYGPKGKFSYSTVYRDLEQLARNRENIRREKRPFKAGDRRQRNYYFLVPTPKPPGPPSPGAKPRKAAPPARATPLPAVDTGQQSALELIQRQSPSYVNTGVVASAGFNIALLALLGFVVVPYAMNATTDDLAGDSIQLMASLDVEQEALQEEHAVTILPTELSTDAVAEFPELTPSEELTRPRYSPVPTFLPPAEHIGPPSLDEDLLPSPAELAPILPTRRDITGDSGLPDLDVAEDTPRVPRARTAELAQLPPSKAIPIEGENQGESIDLAKKGWKLVITERPDPGIKYPQEAIKKGLMAKVRARLYVNVSTGEIVDVKVIGIATNLPEHKAFLAKSVREEVMKWKCKAYPEAPPELVTSAIAPFVFLPQSMPREKFDEWLENKTVTVAEPGKAKQQFLAEQIEEDSPELTSAEIVEYHPDYMIAATALGLVAVSFGQRGMSDDEAKARDNYYSDSRRVNALNGSLGKDALSRNDNIELLHSDPEAIQKIVQGLLHDVPEEETPQRVAAAETGLQVHFAQFRENWSASGQLANEMFRQFEEVCALLKDATPQEILAEFLTRTNALRQSHPDLAEEGFDGLEGFFVANIDRLVTGLRDAQRRGNVAIYRQDSVEDLTAVTFEQFYSRWYTQGLLGVVQLTYLDKAFPLHVEEEGRNQMSRAEKVAGNMLSKLETASSQDQLDERWEELTRVSLPEAQRALRKIKTAIDRDFKQGQQLTLAQGQLADVIFEAFNPGLASEVSQLPSAGEGSEVEPVAWSDDFVDRVKELTASDNHVTVVALGEHDPRLALRDFGEEVGNGTARVVVPVRDKVAVPGQKDSAVIPLKTTDGKWALAPELVPDAEATLLSSPTGQAFVSDVTLGPVSEVMNDPATGLLIDKALSSQRQAAGEDVPIPQEKKGSLLARMVGGLRKTSGYAGLATTIVGAILGSAILSEAAQAGTAGDSGTASFTFSSAEGLQQHLKDYCYDVDGQIDGAELQLTGGSVKVDVEKAEGTTTNGIPYPAYSVTLTPVGGSLVLTQGDQTHTVASGESLNLTSNKKGFGATLIDPHQVYARTVVAPETKETTIIPTKRRPIEVKPFEGKQVYRGLNQQQVNDWLNKDWAKKLAADGRRPVIALEQEDGTVDLKVDKVHREEIPGGKGKKRTLSVTLSIKSNKGPMWITVGDEKWWVRPGARVQFSIGYYKTFKGTGDIWTTELDGQQNVVRITDTLPSIEALGEYMQRIGDSTGEIPVKIEGQGSIAAHATARPGSITHVTLVPLEGPLKVSYGNTSYEIPKGEGLRFAVSRKGNDLFAIDVPDQVETIPTAAPRLSDAELTRNTAALHSHVLRHRKKIIPVREQTQKALTEYNKADDKGKNALWVSLHKSIDERLSWEYAYYRDAWIPFLNANIQRYEARAKRLADAGIEDEGPDYVAAYTELRDQAVLSMKILERNRQLCLALAHLGYLPVLEDIQDIPLSIGSLVNGLDLEVKGAQADLDQQKVPEVQAGGWILRPGGSIAMGEKKAATFTKAHDEIKTLLMLTRDHMEIEIRRFEREIEELKGLPEGTPDAEQIPHEVQFREGRISQLKARQNQCEACAGLISVADPSTRGAAEPEAFAEAQASLNEAVLEAQQAKIDQLQAQIGQMSLPLPEDADEREEKRNQHRLNKSRIELVFLQNQKRQMEASVKAGITLSPFELDRDEEDAREELMDQRELIQSHRNLALAQDAVIQAWNQRLAAEGELKAAEEGVVDSEFEKRQLESSIRRARAELKQIEHALIEAWGELSDAQKSLQRAMRGSGLDIPKYDITYMSRKELYYLRNPGAWQRQRVAKASEGIGYFKAQMEKTRSGIARFERLLREVNTEGIPFIEIRRRFAEIGYKYQQDAAKLAQEGFDNAMATFEQRGVAYVVDSSKRADSGARLIHVLNLASTIPGLTEPPTAAEIEFNAAESSNLEAGRLDVQIALLELENQNPTVYTESEEMRLGITIERLEGAIREALDTIKELEERFAPISDESEIEEIKKRIATMKAEIAADTKEMAEAAKRLGMQLEPFEDTDKEREIRKLEERIQFLTASGEAKLKDARARIAAMKAEIVENEKKIALLEVKLSQVMEQRAKAVRIRAEMAAAGIAALEAEKAIASAKDDQEAFDEARNAWELAHMRHVAKNMELIDSELEYLKGLLDRKQPTETAGVAELDKTLIDRQMEELRGKRVALAQLLADMQGQREDGNPVVVASIEETAGDLAAIGVIGQKRTEFAEAGFARDGDKLVRIVTEGKKKFKGTAHKGTGDLLGRGAFFKKIRKGKLGAGLNAPEGWLIEVFGQTADGTSGKFWLRVNEPRTSYVENSTEEMVAGVEGASTLSDIPVLIGVAPQRGPDGERIYVYARALIDFKEQEIAFRDGRKVKGAHPEISRILVYHTTDRWGEFTDTETTADGKSVIGDVVPVDEEVPVAGGSTKIELEEGVIALGKRSYIKRGQFKSEKTGKPSDTQPGSKGLKGMQGRRGTEGNI